MGSSRLLQDDFHAAVLPFTYAIGCWQKWIRFAEAARHNFIAWNATAQQLSRDRVSAAHRKTLIVLIRTGTVRMAIHFNADHFVTAGGSCLTDEPARAISQFSLIPINEYQIGLCCGWRRRSGHDGGGVEGVTKSKEDRVVGIINIKRHF